MKQRGWGRVINIAAAHALIASPYKSAYMAAKHGSADLTKTALWFRALDARAPGFGLSGYTQDAEAWRMAGEAAGVCRNGRPRHSSRRSELIDHLSQRRYAGAAYRRFSVFALIPTYWLTLFFLSPDHHPPFSTLLFHGAANAATGDRPWKIGKSRRAIFIWIGLHEPTEAEMAFLKAAFNLHELSVNDALDPLQTPKLSSCDDQMFVLAQTAKLNGDGTSSGSITLSPSGQAASGSRFATCSLTASRASATDEKRLPSRSMTSNLTAKKARWLSAGMRTPTGMPAYSTTCFIRESPIKMQMGGIERTERVTFDRDNHAFCGRETKFV